MKTGFIYGREYSAQSMLADMLTSRLYDHDYGQDEIGGEVSHDEAVAIVMSLMDKTGELDGYTAKEIASMYGM